MVPKAGSPDPQRQVAGLNYAFLEPTALLHQKLWGGAQQYVSYEAPRGL